MNLIYLSMKRRSMCDLSSPSLVSSGFSPLFRYIQIYLTLTTFESESEIEIVNDGSTFF